MPRYALVTGASRGLGRLFAVALAKQGHALLLTARSLTGLETTRDAVAAAVRGQAPPEVRVVAADLATPAGLDTLFAASRGLDVDYVVNNAGFGLGGPFAQHDAQALRALLRLNVEASTAIAHHFMPQLQRHRGTLINLASQAALQPVPYMAAYAASKAYVLHLSEALAHECRAAGVTVAAICPPATATEFFDKANIALERTRLSPIAPQAVVDEALRAVARGQAVVLPGLFNKLLGLTSRLAPRPLTIRMAQAMVWRP